MNRNYIFLFRDHILIKPPGRTSGAADIDQLAFIPRVIQSLAQLCRQDAYELVLATGSQQEEPALEEEASRRVRRVHEKMIEICKSEGIEFTDIHTDPVTLQEWKASGDLSQSVVIGAAQQDIAIADSLGCRSLLFADPAESDDAVLRDAPSCAAVTNDWSRITALLLGSEQVLPDRKAAISRKTSETDISVAVNLDGSGAADITTGLGFFDHMLHQLARHGKMDLKVHASGDLDVDEHHTIEDTAIVLGQAVAEALGDKRGIRRYGFLLPMDDALAQAAVDFSGRPWFQWDVTFRRAYVGDVPTDMISHFFKSFADDAKCNLSLKAEGNNDHHIAEALFKAFARAVRMAVRRDPLDMELPSTKGAL